MGALKPIQKRTKQLNVYRATEAAVEATKNYDCLAQKCKIISYTSAYD